jgi:hypothetical protein
LTSDLVIESLGEPFFSVVSSLIWTGLLLSIVFVGRSMKEETSRGLLSDVSFLFVTSERSVPARFHLILCGVLWADLLQIDY